MTAELDLFEREADAFEQHAWSFLATARSELPEELWDVVTVQGGEILAAIERITRAKALASGLRPPSERQDGT